MTQPPDPQQPQWWQPAAGPPGTPQGWQPEQQATGPHPGQWQPAADSGTGAYTGPWQPPAQPGGSGSFSGPWQPGQPGGGAWQPGSDPDQQGGGAWQPGGAPAQPGQPGGAAAQPGQPGAGPAQPGQPGGPWQPGGEQGGGPWQPSPRQAAAGGPGQGPQYGGGFQPAQYGGLGVFAAEPAKPPKSKKPLLFGGIGVLVLVAGGVAAWLLGAFRGNVLDQQSLQDGVVRVLNENYGEPDVKNAQCPKDELAQNGTTFDCTVRIGGQDKKVTVRVLNDRPEYEVGAPH